MSANPHNPSLGLPDDRSHRAPSYPPAMSANLAAIRLPGKWPESFYTARKSRLALPTTCLDTKLFKLCSRSPACTSSYACDAPCEKSGDALDADVWQLEQFVLDEVLQLVAERARTLTGADGIAIAMAEDDAIVCRAAAGTSFPNQALGSIRNQDFPEPACVPAESCAATIRRTIRE